MLDDLRYLLGVRTQEEEDIVDMSQQVGCAVEKVGGAGRGI